MTLLTPRRALVALVALGAAALPAAAGADPITYASDSVGVQVTLGTSAVAPSSTVAVSGSGYAAGQWVIFKIDRANNGASGTAGGADAVPTATTAGTAAAGWPTFVTESDGSFDGTIAIPATIATAADAAGRHVYNALSGTLPAAGGKIAGLTAYFTFGDTTPTPAVALGTPAAASAVAGTTVTVAGTGFAPSTTVTATLDGGGFPVTLATDADGAFSGPFTVPAATPAGAHALTFTAGATSANATLTTTAVPSDPGGGGGGTVVPAVAVTTPTVAQGGSIGIAITGFVKTGGGGQKVGIRIDDSRTLSDCVQTDGSGNATASIPVPDGLAAGEHLVRFLAGTACVSGGPPIEPEARSMTGTFTLVGDPAAATSAAPSDPGSATSAGGAGTGGSGDGPAPAAPVATAALKVGSTLKATKSGRVTLPVRLSGAARGTVAMRTAAKVQVGQRRRVVTLVAKRAWTVAAPGTATLTLKLTGEGRRLLARHGTLRARVTVVDGAGRASSKVVTLR
jgi:hypothetical protein